MMLKKWLQYLSTDLWNFRLSEKRGWDRFRLKWLRVFVLSIKGFLEDQCALRASSLTYYTLISIVPVLAMTLAVAGGFGYRDPIRERLLSYFADQRDAFVQIIQFADDLLEHTRGGVIAGVGLIVLFWSVASLLSSMESALNQIWGVASMRSWRRILSDYSALMLIAPICFLLSSSGTVLAATFLQSAIRELHASAVFIYWLDWIAHLIPYFLFWGLFTFLFIFMPNTKVRFRSALVGGGVSAILYVITQWGYIHFQIGVSRYGAIYGSFAALPLFLIWIQLSWFLVLFGAETSYAHQSLEFHEFGEATEKMSVHLRRLLSLWISYLVVRHFIAGKGALGVEELVKEHKIPRRVASQVAQELVESRVLIEIKGEKEEPAYVPGRSPDELLISDVCDAVDSRGVTDWPWIESHSWKHLDQTLLEFQKLIRETPENKRLRDIE